MHLSGTLEKDGFEIHGDIFAKSELSILEKAAEDIEGLGLNRGGGRNIFSTYPGLLEVFKKTSLLALTGRILGGEPGISEGLFLNKKTEANWLVAWHQDLFISVKSEMPAEGYSGWTMKQGKPYVQPPIAVLERSLWVRVNLDDNSVDNGCLKVVPGSHRLGKVRTEEAGRVAEECGEHALPCSAGDVILFRPLLLHSSSKSVQPSRRRVIQVLYSGYRFRNGLEWPY